MEYSEHMEREEMNEGAEADFMELIEQEEERPASLELMVLVNYLAKMSLMDNKETERIRHQCIDLIAKMEREKCQKV